MQPNFDHAGSADKKPRSGELSPELELTAGVVNLRLQSNPVLDDELIGVGVKYHVTISRVHHKEDAFELMEVTSDAAGAQLKTYLATGDAGASATP